jgi:hypothetical protein
MPTLSGSDRALDSVDRFIRVGGEIAKMPILAMPEYKTAADGLFEISRKLLAANENLARWLYRWVYFDFKASNAREQFFTLVKDYRSARSGPAFQAMKAPCGDIVSIYDVRIADKIAPLRGGGRPGPACGVLVPCSASCGVPTPLERSRRDAESRCCLMPPRQ